MKFKKFILGIAVLSMQISYSFFGNNISEATFDQTRPMVSSPFGAGASVEYAQRKDSILEEIKKKAYTKEQIATNIAEWQKVQEQVSKKKSDLENALAKLKNLPLMNNEQVKSVVNNRISFFSGEEKAIGEIIAAYEAIK